MGAKNLTPPPKTQQYPLNQLRETNVQLWENYINVLTGFYNLFRGLGYFKEIEQAFGLEGSFEHFEKLFDEGYFQFIYMPQVKLVSIHVWSETIGEYLPPGGPNTIPI